MNAHRPLIPLLCVVALTLALSACLGSSSGPPAPLAVEFSTPPPNSDALGTSFQVAAAVSNGSSVNWSCMPTGSCGSFSPTQTGSGVSTTYMPPMTVPQGGSVTIMAISVQDNTKEASANVTITAGGAVSVTFNAPAPPPTLATNAVAQVSATITSTVANAVSDGIDWTATCTNSAGGGCGMFTTAHTNSGVSTTYSPPTTVPVVGVAVTVEAASTLDPLDNVSAVVNVSTTQTSAFLCAGCSYTYVLSGEDANGPFSLAGVFSTNGLGMITGAEQDFSDFALTTGSTPNTLVAGTSYSFGPDGRGTINLNTGNASIGANGVETLGVVMVSSSHALITQLDASATASGTMDLQTVSSFSTSTLSGGYTFVVGGETFSQLPFGFGGVFNVSSANISGSGSTSDINSGLAVSKQQSLTGGYAVSDNLGRIQLTLRSTGFGAVNLTGPMVLDGYITDATHIKLIEVDTTLGVSSGLAIGQGAMTGKLNSASDLPANASYVFTSFGAVPSGTVALATTFTSDGSSKLQNGASDVNYAGVPTSGSVNGTYSVDPTGTGRVAISLMGNTIVGNPNTADIFAIYLTGGADPPLALELDGAGVTTGNLYAQSAGSFSLSSFQGSYGLNFTLFDPNEEDASGQAFADGSGNLLGTLDVNTDTAGVAPQQAVGFTGLYASAASGRFTGSLSPAGTSTLGFSYFVVSPSEVIIIETDSLAVTLGLFQLQTPPF